MDQSMRMVILTGLSGAGKTLAMNCLEDIGYFCIDNLPPTFVPKFAEICAQSGGKLNKVALAIDLRGGDFFNDLSGALTELEKKGFTYEILFLEASDETLIQRFKETRRRHPLAPKGRVLEGIRFERDRLVEIRGLANKIINTSGKTPQQLRKEITDIYATGSNLERLVVTIVSFGFTYGVPLDADLVFDVRFLPNPFYDAALREKTGNDSEVQDYVMKWAVTEKFMQKFLDLIGFLLPHYAKEGKTHLTIAIGCTGGNHRSVTIANKLFAFLKGEKYNVIIEHRDMDRWRQRRELHEGV